MRKYHPGRNIHLDNKFKDLREIASRISLGPPQKLLDYKPGQIFTHTRTQEPYTLESIEPFGESVKYHLISLKGEKLVARPWMVRAFKK